MPKKICPRCGHDEFIVTAHVTQDWLVDRNGQFKRCLNDCVETAHRPDDDDIWTCNNCGHDAPGREFNTEE